MVATSVKTAVCFAGAFRNWRESWRHLQPNLVDSLDADVFAVSDDAGRGAIPGVHGGADAAFTVARMRETFGARFRAGEHWAHARLQNFSAWAWPEIGAAQAARPAHKAFPYLFKVWRCGQLVARSGVAYDIVVRLRPDLSPLAPLRVARVAGGGGDAAFELRVGDGPSSCVRFGDRAVVVHALTNYCGNDWFALGSRAAMTVTMDLLRFWGPHSAWLSPDPAFDELAATSVEVAHNQLWWRTGTQVLRRSLLLDLTRQRCARPECVRVPAWILAARASGAPAGGACAAAAAPEAAAAAAATRSPLLGGAMRAKLGLANDCGAPGGGGDLDYFSFGPAMAVGTAAAGGAPAAATARLAGKAIEPPRVVRTATPPRWERPDCGDVADLSAHAPLPPCKKRTGDADARTPRAHAPRVRDGYGVPLVFGREPDR